ncbi:molybdate ABC transporter substrate-binding protein [Nocardioides sp. SYSU DS0663]|uniref:molybdate ABC transporter substrate-binding protein n=1 Tax=Nocardioides sp. SYSU DS0663 TaxID=3416445 RepID=UPI003F4BF7E9
MRRGLAAAALLMAATTAGCADDGGDSEVLLVFAAASLAAPFEELATDFEAAHPGVDVQLNLAGSSDLAAQVRDGAPADVLATADEITMASVVGADLTTPPRAFATNIPTIAVPAGNPAGVRSIEDLAAPGIDVVVCAPEVPCGAAAERVAELEGVPLDPVSEERSVTDVLGKVGSGQADAGLVYVTDVRAAGDAVEEVALPRAGEVVTSYPIVALRASDHPELAQEFVGLVLGQEGRQVLDDAGFGRP